MRRYGSFRSPLQMAQIEGAARQRLACAHPLQMASRDPYEPAPPGGLHFYPHALLECLLRPTRAENPGERSPTLLRLIQQRCTLVARELLIHVLIVSLIELAVRLGLPPAKGRPLL